MTDKELVALLPKLPLDQQIEHVIAKYLGGSLSRWHDGETAANIGDAGIAKDLVSRMKRLGLLPLWKPIAEVPRDVTRAIFTLASIQDGRRRQPVNRARRWRRGGWLPRRRPAVGRRSGSGIKRRGLR